MPKSKKGILGTFAAPELYDTALSYEGIVPLQRMKVLLLLQCLTLGHPDTPFSLSICFNRGEGVKKDSQIANFMYLLAAELGDKRCTLKSEPPLSIKSQIKNINELMKETQAKIPKEGANIAVLERQAQIFNNKLKECHITIPIWEEFRGEASTELTHNSGTANNNDVELNFLSPPPQHIDNNMLTSISEAASEEGDKVCCCVGLFIDIFFDK